MKRRRLALLGLLLLPLVGALLLHQGILWFHNPSLRSFPVQGLDVSHHQGDIDWPAVAAAARHRFVWIKATEGGDWVDTRFQANWDGAQAAGLLVGGYHFFTFCRTGAEQADNFLRTVPRVPGTLPPVIDLEFGGNCSRRPSRDELLPEITHFLTRLEAHYGTQPILYTTRDFQQAYMAPALRAWPLWTRSIVRRPAPEPAWLIWQFSNRGRVPGISTFVDENVFAGSLADLEARLVP